MRRSAGSWGGALHPVRTLVLPIVMLFSAALAAQVDSLERVLAGLPEDSTRLQVLRALFRAEVFRMPARALERAEAYAALADAGGTARQRALGQAMTGQALYVGGYGLRALPHFQRALAIYRAEGLVGDAGLLQANVASILADGHRWPKALSAYQRAIADLERGGEPKWAAGVEGELADVWQALGRPDSAAVHYGRSAEALERFGMADHAREVRLDGAGALLRSGRTEQALDLFRSSDTASVRSTAPLILIRLLLRSGRWSLAHGQHAEADSLLRRALHLAVDGGFIVERIRGHEALVELAEARSLPDSALVHLRHAIQWKDTLDTQSDAAAILALERRASDEELTREPERVVRARGRLRQSIATAATAGRRALALWEGRGS